MNPQIYVLFLLAITDSILTSGPNKISCSILSISNFLLSWTIRFFTGEINQHIRPTQLTNEEIGRLCHVYNYLCQEHPYIASYDYRNPDKKRIVQDSRKLEIDKIEQQILLGPDVRIESVIANKNNT
jgi:hypothetical protein